MSSCKELLNEFEYYSNNEEGLEQKKNSNREKYNFERMMLELEEKRHDESIDTRFKSNIEAAKELTSKFRIVHNTNLNNLISIIQNKALLSVEEMEKRDISFNFRITFRGINEEMHNYVFGTTQQGDPIYGLYELVFKDEVQRLKGAIFMPKSFLEYGQEVVSDYLMDIKDWKNYLAEEIAINYENPKEYINSTPTHLRPEFLFDTSVPIEYIESIECINKDAFELLTSKIKEEFGGNIDILNIIKIKGQ